MKILHIITRLDRGGSTEDVLYHALSQREKGHSVFILFGETTAPSEELIADARDKGVEFISLPSLRRDIRPLNDLRALAGIFLTLSDVRPDVLHTHTSKAGFLGRVAALPHRIFASRRMQVLHSTHGHVFYGYYGPFLSRLFVLLEKIAAAFTDRIIVLTENEREEHLARGIGESRRFCVVHSGISFEECRSTPGLRKALGIPGDAIVVGSAGRFDPVKGYLTFIEALKLLRDQRRGEQPYFLLIGDGSQRVLIEEQLRRYELSGHTVLTGWVRDPDDHIAICDIYVQPSLNEGMGKTIVTAQRLGKPVVATRVQGIVSLIKDNETGLLIPPNNAEELAGAIGRLLSDPLLRSTLGANACSAAGQRSPDTGFPLFSIEQMNYLLDRLYDEVFE